MALAIGRIGCFFNGDDYGLPVTEVTYYPSQLGVVFPALGDNLTRVPTQILETIVCLVLVASSLIAKEKIKEIPAGFSGLVLTLGYGIYRFFAENMRGDYRGELISSQLTPSQHVSILLISISLIVLFYLLKLTQKNE